MKLTALKTFRHGPQTFRRGHAVEMSEAQAKPLIAKRFVEATKAAPKKDKNSEAEGLAALTNVKLHELAEAEGIAVESDDNKASLVDKIIAGRAAKA